MSEERTLPVSIEGDFVYLKGCFKPQKVKGMSIYHLSRFDSDTKHVVVIKVVNWECRVGDKGDYMRFFLNDDGYQKALEEKKKGYIEIIEDKKVVNGDILPKDGGAE